jgi:hypothetical protein
MWEGPYRISQCVPGNAYILETLEGEKFARELHGKYLEKYYPCKSSYRSLNAQFGFRAIADSKRIAFSTKNKIANG